MVDEDDAGKAWAKTRGESRRLNAKAKTPAERHWLEQGLHKQAKAVLKNLLTAANNSASLAFHISFLPTQQIFTVLES